MPTVKPTSSRGAPRPPGVAFGTSYQNGGHIRVLSPSGRLLCERNTNEEVDSSPAVGQFLAGGGVGIVAGTGNTFKASDNKAVIAINSHCGLAWEDHLDGITASSPALVDALGNGQLQVAEGTNNGSTGGIWLLNGPEGHVLWHVAAIGPIIGSITSADLGPGYQDLLVPTGEGLQIVDGKTGATVAIAERGILGMQDSPLVTDDPNGTIGITIAGFTGSTAQNLHGEIFHFEVPGSHGDLVNEKGAWPMFHHDPQLTGSAGTPAPTIRVPCRPPSGKPLGYYMDASDGGIFTFGHLPFCGSTGGIVLNKPIVGMAATSDAGGYWLVASDGGIFAFGDAEFFGSTGGDPPEQADRRDGGHRRTAGATGWWRRMVGSSPSVTPSSSGRPAQSTSTSRSWAWRATPDGKGYWLVASDGGHLRLR